MQRPPRRVNAPILDAALGYRTLLISAVIGAFAFGFFEWAELSGLSHEQARTIAVNTIVVAEVGYLFACRSLRLPSWRIGVLTNKWVWLGSGAMLLTQLAFTDLPIMNMLLHSQPFEAWRWLPISGAGLAVFVVAELKKQRASDRGDTATR